MNSGRYALAGFFLRWVAVLALPGLLLAACIALDVTDAPAPMLVTLPASTPKPTPTPGEETPTPTTAAATPTPTSPVPPSPPPATAGLGAAELLWEWGEVAPPSALAATRDRLAVIVADGRFVWLDADSGRMESSAFLWSGLLQGDSWGEVYTDGVLAVVAVREMSINPETGLADSRARLVVYDVEANELWALPELGPQHFYSVALTVGSVIVGTWPYNERAKNSLAAYELFTGEQLWEAGEGPTGYRQIVHDGTRLYVLLDDEEGSAVASFDLRTGEELWRWSDPDVVQPDLLLLRERTLYILTADRVVALDSLGGGIEWKIGFNVAPEAGMVVREDLLYLVPAPTEQLGFRPGLIGLHADSGKLAWHSLGGLVVDPLVVSEETLWTVVKDFDSGDVSLSGLEPDTGLERVRIAIGSMAAEPDVLYKLVALGRRVYVLGKSLRAYGY